MKLIRYQFEEKMEFGSLEEQTVRRLKGDIGSGFSETGETVPLCRVRLLSPVMPGKAVCIGLNYKDHIAESGAKTPESPVVFLKPSTAVIAPQQEIEYPAISSHVDYEGELAIVIGKRAKQVERENAAEYILGYTCANDVSARDYQPADGQWTIAKGFDTFLPLGPCIQTQADPVNLEIRTYLNGRLVQHSNTSQLLFQPYELVSYLSQVMTLEPGDVILTGTPSGVGPIHPGDAVDVEIEQIGRLTNTVRAAQIRSREALQ
ncbi:fumarylacetoacetate hydrolase family protein [Clostridium sp. KNHs216]|uniref:fumarylacetoacetate hydrolase family protein n=1 Tax=Clostridium sp. KNHs216 TaxID=1550235 RepID=UPI00114DFAC3|nr:fumarylacetoacetate hydrolase family protein [Clostridium sp. KNHs216]TQI66852.1 2-keto-4-pentenoate hydratase/2-oxohepta-3-ene-1,7-dioic acid hydratase in catechol pathway [Clostridium sp. KNHs216]